MSARPGANCFLIWQGLCKGCFMPKDYITVDNINHINAELSNYCNASCPMCARFDSSQKLIKDITNNAHTKLQDIKDKIGEKVIKNLHTFRSCGTVGDGTMNPECADIFDYVTSVNPDMITSINTNGGARDKQFFKDLATIGVRVVFSIDGLEDTNHLYRRNVKWHKLMENAESFIQAGGHASWDFLVFKHNQHQIEQAENLSKSMGFKSFHKKSTTRWDDFDSAGNWMQRDKIMIEDYALEKPHTETVKDVDNAKDIKEKDVSLAKKILCKSFTQENIEITLHANGNVSPCCYLGNLKIHESKNIIKDYTQININHSTLEQILDSEYFQEIWKGIQGQVQDYKLITCVNVCGSN